MIKFRNLLSNIIKVKPQRSVIAYFHRLEENDYFKLKSKDLNITSEIESNKSELLKILKDFSEDLIYLDIHKSRRLEPRLFGLEKYIKVSEDTSKRWSIRSCQILFLCVFLGFLISILSPVFPSLTARYGIYASLAGLFLIILFVSALLLLLSSIHLNVYWYSRAIKYQGTSFTLNRFSNKTMPAIDLIDWDYYIERVCKIPIIFIKNSENILSYELRKMEREFDTSLELVYIPAFIVAYFAVFSSSKIGLINSTSLAVIGFGVVIAIFLAFCRYSSRKTKDFSANCLEQLLLLLRLAQNKLDSKN